MKEPRPSPTKASTINMTGNQRLRAAASFSPYNNPTSMAVRLSGSGRTSLGAIAGPMGVNIVDLAAPQSSLMVLDYSSSVGVSNTASSGGISTMAFQPDPSVLQCQSYLTDSNGRNSGSLPQSSSSVLLATARGNGILIWDCSGRALSPLLGRLNAADSWSGAKLDESESDSGADHVPPPLSAASPARSLNANASATLDTVQSLNTPPISLERNVSYQSSTSIPNITNTTGAKPPKSNSINSINSVTSLAWKGPTVPILISTSGNSVCLFDLRTSLFSGVGVKGGGARPNARFMPPSQGGSLIHCAYAYDESHMFSTLDSNGVVRVWDDRKAGNESCLASFVACSRHGVGIASMPPSAKMTGSEEKSAVGPRWLTWGIDQSDDDDLVVKVWSPTKSNVQSADKDYSNDEGGDGYQLTSKISMNNGVAARMHPAFSDVVLVFRSNGDPREKEIGLEQDLESSRPTGKQLGMRSVEESPDWRTGRSPEISDVISTPPSPPPLMLQECEENDEVKDKTSQEHRTGWEAELWRIDVNDSDPGTKDEETRGKTNVTCAQKIVSFHGGNSDEDALSFVPGRGDESAGAEEDEIIAIDLSMGNKLEEREKGGHNTDELVLCSLAKKGCLRVYSIPEATNEEATDKKQENKSLKARIYRGHDDGIQPSPWWKGQQEKEDVATAEASPQKEALRLKRESSTQFDIELTSPFEEQIDTRNIPIISEESSSRATGGVISTTNEDLDIDASTDVHNIPIDPVKASRVPCPPLCGAAFCAGGAGGLVTFTNGPVSKMFAWYKSSDKKRRNTIPLHNPEMPLISGRSSVATEKTNDTSSGDQERIIKDQKLPRTVFDLLEMQSSAKIAQWGHDDNDNDTDSSNEGDASGSSDESSSSSYEDVEVVLDSESSDSDDEGFFHVAKAYNDYFSTARKPLLEASADNDSNAHQNTDKDSSSDDNDTDDANQNFAGPSSISPAVSITGKYNDIVFNGQSPELANLLQLGDCWWLANDFSVPDYGGKQSDVPAVRRNENKSIHRNTSDPSLTHNPWPGLERTWSLQPVQKNKNKQKSMMGNIKRLMPPGIIMSTPPDQRLIEKKEQTNDLVEKQASQSNIPQVKDSTNIPLGVYMLENPQTPDAAADRLSITRDLCIQNAEICKGCGQQSKADTWTLIAQTIESMEIFEADVYDGWGGAADALTTGIIEQILRYYESQADYQMLATIVCVLTFGRDRRKSASKSIGTQDDYQLLPNFDDRRYDNYLYHYASLLYGWGILTVRSEISKRLTYGIPGGGAEIIVTQTETSEEKSTSSTIANTGVAGITFTPICQKCLAPVDDSNICGKCKDYAFQCSICCHAVRGACLWCPICTHGGHAEHMMSWFENHQMCPTGCGCLCMVSKSGQSDDQG